MKTIQTINISDTKKINVEPDAWVGLSDEHLKVITIETKAGLIHINCYSKENISIKNIQGALL